MFDFIRLTEDMEGNPGLLQVMTSNKAVSGPRDGRYIWMILQGVF